MAALVLGSDLKVRGVVVTDRRASEAAKLRDELLAILTPPAPKPAEGKDADPKDAPKPGATPAETKPDGPKGPSGKK